MSDRKQSMSLNTLDIVVIAVIGVLFGILNGPFGIIYQSFQAAFGPIGANIFGVFNLSPVLAMYIVRKPGTAFINMMINGVVQMLAGNPAGIITLGWGFTQGLGAELIFAAYRYRRYNALVCFLAGGLGANTLSNVWTYYVYGFGAAGWQAMLSGTLLGVFTYGVLSGLVAYGIGRLLRKAGVLKSFRAGTEGDAEVYEAPASH